MTNKSPESGAGLMTMIFILLLGLKLAEVGAVANLSWWWVTAPLWGPAVLACVCLIIAGALLLVAKR